MGRLAGDHAHLIRQVGPQFVLLHAQQSAVGVVDDDELLRVEQVMRDDEGANGVVGGDASGVANHVGIAGLQAQAAFEQDSGVPAGQYGQATTRLNRQISQVEVLYEFFVGL